jgi:hypothetical protein
MVDAVTKVFKDKVQSQVDLATEQLILVHALVQDPRVARDPVIKALIQGLSKGNDDFKTASLVVATLRNAGCVGNSEEKTKVKDTGSKTKKDKNPTIVVKESQHAKKLRGLDRSIDYLIGTRTIGADHPSILSIRNLRSDKDKIVKIEKEDGVVIDRKVSAMSDFDLLYLLDRVAYDLLLKDIGPLTQPEVSSTGYLKGLFGYWNQSLAHKFIVHISEKVSAGKENELYQASEGNSNYAVLARALKGTVMVKILQMLKDSTVKNFADIPSNEEIALLMAIVDTLIREKWFKFGKSPTLKSLVK